MPRLLARTSVGKLRYDYTGGSVTTSAWVSLGTVPAACSAIEAFDSSGRTIKLSLNNGTTELPFYITPGGPDGLIPVEIKKNATLYGKAVDATASVGQLLINFYG